MELKMAGDKKRPSAFFTGVNNYLSACGNAKQNGQRLSWFVARTRIFQAKAVYMVLGSSKY